MKKVLVAGSTGYLGRFAVQAFKQRGYWVRALARNPGKLESAGPFLEPAVAESIDEVFVGEVTRPETLHGLCDGIDIVFSSIGITRQKDGLYYRDVDYQGNRNILDIALQEPVQRFVYVSVFEGHLYEHLEIVKAHEDFVRDLQDSGLDCCVVRPTGYFSDMSEFLRMAKAGRVYLIGDGGSRVNPIHGADLAEVCVDASAGDTPEVPVGGPETFTVREIAELAFSTLGTRPKITRIPPVLVRFAIGAVRVFNRQMSDLIDFFATASQSDGVAPAAGTRTLRAYYAELASAWAEREG